MPTNKAVIYARVSSKEQEREGYSIPAQLKLLKSYAQKNNYEIIREFIDVETAKQSGRTNFNEMVKFLSANPEVKIILCEKTDRLYRNFKDYVIIDDLDLTLIFVKEGSVLNKHSRSHEKFIHGIKVLMAKNYIDNLSEETRKGLLEKAEEGEYPAYAPLGYKHDKIKKTIEIDEKRAPIIREMFQLYSTEKYSIRGLVNYVSERGLTTRKGRRVVISTIDEILKNPFYHGDFLWNGKIYHGKHPVIITKDLFEKVQLVIQSRNITRVHKRGFTYTGLLKCGKCGCSITAEIKKGTYIYYHCTFNKGKCHSEYIREEELEKQFGNVLKVFQFSDVVLNWMKEALRLSQKEKEEFHIGEIKKLQEQYLKLQNRIDQMYLDKLDGEITEDFYRRHVLQWRNEQDRIQVQIKRHQKADENYIEQGITLLEIAKNAYEYFQKRRKIERATIINFIMPESKLINEKIVPIFKPPFNIIYDMSKELREIPQLKQNKKVVEGFSTTCPTRLPETNRVLTKNCH